MTAPDRRPAVFISYSHKDADWRDRIREAIETRVADQAEILDDSNLRPGDTHEEWLASARARAAVALLLISPDYLESEYIRSREVPELLQRKGQGSLRVIPVLIRHSEWESVPWLSPIQLFPSPPKPLAAAGRDLPRLLHVLGEEVAAALFEPPTATEEEPPTTAEENASSRLARAITAELIGAESPACAALVQRGLAVTIAQPIPPEAHLRFHDGQTVGVRAHTSTTVWPELMVLALAQPVDQPDPVSYIRLKQIPRGARWECYRPSVRWRMWGAVAGETSIEGQPARRLKVNEGDYSPQLRGSPVIVDGKIAGFLHSHDGTEWLAVPAIEMPALLPKDEPPAEPVPPAASAKFDRFNPQAQKVLSIADQFRTARSQNRVHMEHLILALAEERNGAMEHALVDARLDDTRLRSALAEAAHTDLSKLPAPKWQSGLSLPPVSVHVQAALDRAAALASDAGSATINTHELTIAALTLDKCSVTEALIAAGVTPPVLTPPSARRRRLEELPGFNADDATDPKAEDLLGIDQDVNAICDVLAAADTVPPLSLGLFGDWGTGKSFFMHRMQRRIDELQEIARNSDGTSVYCANVVQISFNAWHYIDTSLWASLTAEIFEGLAKWIARDRAKDSAFERTRALAATANSRQVLVEAEKERTEAEAALGRSSQELVDLEKSKVVVQAALRPDALAREASNLAMEQPEVQDKVRQAADQLKISEASAVVAGIRKDLLEIRGLWDALRVAFRHANDTWMWALAFLAGLIIVASLVLLPWAVENWQPALVLAVSVLGSVGAFLTRAAPLVKGAKQALGFLEEARKSKEALIEKEKNTQREALQQRQRDLETLLEEARKRVENARTAVTESEQRLEALRADRQMLHFVKERNESSDYTQHFGVIARAHHDFRKLSVLMEEIRKQKRGESNTTIPELENLPLIDRVVLYIDDLDRCPEQKVMDVLQAVHLLLAFPLFIVVVGVDPRWLLHSLSTRSSALRRAKTITDGSPVDGELWRSTPMNYLEKIFQIPFTLRPMSRDGFGEMIEHLAMPKPQVGVRAAAPAAAGAGTVEPPQAALAGEPGAATEPGIAPPPEASKAGMLAKHHTVDQPKEKSRPPEKDPENLRISEEERQSMKTLFRLIPTPRAVKRFVNIYRLIRASVDSRQISRFVGEHSEYKAVLLLLAIQTGYPAQGVAILEELLEHARATEPWWPLLDRLIEARVADDTDAGRWTELREQLAGVRDFVPAGAVCGPFIRWADDVARYSFESGRLLFGSRSID